MTNSIRLCPRRMLRDMLMVEMWLRGSCSEMDTLDNRELKALLNDVLVQLECELSNWGEEEAPELVKLIKRVETYLDENFDK